MTKREELTSDYVREFLDYNAETGLMVWKKHPTQKRRNGTIAGGMDSRGYLRLCIFGHQYRMHRVAWLHYYGHWPDGEIDHINGCRTDNRISNLRAVTPQQNIVNRPMHANNKTGLKGVYRKPGKKRYCASITVGRKARHLGYFATPEDAHAAYCRAARGEWGDYFKE